MVFQYSEDPGDSLWLTLLFPCCEFSTPRFWSENV
jgi:hypothetical protein